MKPLPVSYADANILSRMARDYVYAAPCLDGCYHYPFQFSEFNNVIADKSKSTLHRQLLVHVLQRQYKAAGIAGKPLDNIQLLLDANTYTVTTAHQPNIFTGYLFFVYKILCAINIAEQLATEHPDKHFVPVYWMGSEDHDFEEISTINLFGEPLQWQHSSGGPVGRLDVDGLGELMDIIEAKLGNQAFGGELMALLRKAYAPGSTLAQATRYLVHQLFGKYGLVIIDQDDKELKGAFAPVLLDEVLNGRASTIIQGTIDHINQCNYKLQASPREINCFYTGTGKRERIVFDEAQQVYKVLNTAISFTKAEIEQDIVTHTENYSPNVFLRPLYQETVLPNLAYVGGGGEVSYWLELKALFDYYQVNYPMLVLRSSLLLVDKGSQKKMEKLGLTASDLFKSENDLVTEYVKRNSTRSLDLQQEKESLEAMFATIMEKAKLVDVTLQKSVEGQKQSVINAIEGLETKILRAEKRNHEVATGQINAVKNKLFPNNSLQERYDNFLPYYATFGVVWIDEIKPYCNPFDKVLSVLLEE